MKYKTVVVECEEGGYSAFVPALRGCVSEGETIEETLDNIKEAIQDYLEVLNEITEKEKVYEVEVAS